MLPKITLFTLLLSLWGYTALAAEEPSTQNKSKQNKKYVLEENSVFLKTDQSKQALSLPGTPVAILEHDNQLYVAMGNKGVQVFQTDEKGAPTLVQVIPTPQGNAAGFFIANNTVWIEMHATSAIPINDMGSAPSDATAIAPVGPKEPVVVQSPPKATAVKAEPNTNQYGDKPIDIIEIFPGEVKLNWGTDKGVKIDNQFEIYRKKTVQRKGLESFDTKELVAVVEVVAVNKEYCIARLSRGDQIRKDDIVEPREKSQRIKNVFPRKLQNIGEVNIALRPLLNVSGTGGFGGLIDATGSWIGKHYFVNLRMQPMAFGGTDEGNILASTILAEGGYDGRAFAVGLGVGVALVNGDMDSMLGTNYYYEDSSSNAQQAGLGSKAAFALSQIVRLGARDGLNFTVSNNFIYYNDSTASSNEEDNSGFIYGSTSGKLNIPLNAKIDLFFNGGGGRMGYAFGEMGVFAWILGNGGPGSFGISGAAGGASIWVEEVIDDGGYYTERTFIAGPMVSLGLTYRFGPQF